MFVSTDPFHQLQLSQPCPQQLVGVVLGRLPVGVVLLAFARAAVRAVIQSAARRPAQRGKKSDRSEIKTPSLLNRVPLRSLGISRLRISNTGTPTINFGLSEGAPDNSKMLKSSTGYGVPC
ncbi:hypothetical protein AVEN_151855-1 [Araneus ventricosus]|uniref:Uncharacterized protein n=1 Tax=Araneus ventricosus TaxID=182803 RepID=A0A4Y2JL40_ARAVE|nr:hypothetical protein AVEN_151855-1 [Araneus ventricosus]